MAARRYQIRWTAALHGGLGVSALCLLTWTVWRLLPTADASVRAADNAAVYRDKIAPWLARHCADCHSGDEPAGGLDLAKFATWDDVLAQRDVWDRVVLNLQQGIMPPPDAPQPPQREIQNAANWLDRAFFAVDCSGELEPGRVTIRRLNRIEYRNTIRDLLGVDFAGAADFPSDDVGHGFDNIGDVLSLPPLLFEKYLAAAEEIAAQTVVTDAEPSVRHFAVSEMDVQGGGSTVGVEAVNFYSSGTAVQRVQVAYPGQYRLRIRAYGQQAGPEPARVAARINDGEPTVLDVPAVEGEPGEYEFLMELPSGEQRVSLSFVNDYYAPENPDPTQRDRNLVLINLEVEGPFGVPAEALPEPHRRLIYLSPEEIERDPTDAARRILFKFASRAYRRTLNEEETERLVVLYESAREDGGSFTEAIQLCVQAVLVSPHFLFRWEGTPGEMPNETYPLTEFELATRLSYFFYSSMPDEQLFRRAARGELRANLAAEVARLIADPKSQALVENFAGQWLQLRNLDRVQPDVGRFPSFDDELRLAMRQETELFFAHLLREDRSILEFLDANYTFLNDRLAKHYGVEGIVGPEFRQVALDPQQRGGVLSQASVLTVTSNPTRTSPVKRGKWVLEQLLGTPPPPPPANVEQLNEDPQVALSGSLRQRMEMHRAKPDCAVCHNLMDPLGFGLENYDAVGAWRTQDGNFPIDPSGELPDGAQFQGPAELRQILLARKDDFARCLTEKMLTYALGRGLQRYDRCTVEEILARLRANDYRFSALIQGIVESVPFQQRRAAGANP